MRDKLSRDTPTASIILPPYGPAKKWRYTGNTENPGGRTSYHLAAEDGDSMWVSEGIVLETPLKPLAYLGKGRWSPTA